MLCIPIVMLCILLLVSLFLSSSMLCSGYSVSLCCSVYCFCVNVYCTTATLCQPNRIYQIFHSTITRLLLPNILQYMYTYLHICIVIMCSRSAAVLNHTRKLRTFKHSSSAQVIRRSIRNAALKRELYEGSDTSSNSKLEYFHSGKKQSF